MPDQSYRSMVLELKATGLSWRELGSLVGCDPGVLRRIHRGEVSDPRTSVADQITRVYRNLMRRRDD